MKRRSLALATLLGALDSRAETPLVRLVYADYRPYSWLDGDQARGLEVDIAEALLVKRMMLRVQHRILPWARAQAEIEQGEADLFFATRSPARDGFARPLGPPLLHWQAAAFLRSDSPVSIPAGPLQLDTLCQWRLGALNGNQWVSTHLSCGVPMRAQSTESLLRMLLADRFDAAVDDRLVMLDRAAQIGVSARLRVLPIEIGSAPIHLQISRRSRLLHLADSIELTLKAMLAEGALARLAAP